MAEEEAAYGVPVPGGASASRGDLLIRGLDQAGKGKATAAKDPTPSSAGDSAAAMFDPLNLTTQESTAFVLEEDDEDYPGCPIWALVGKVLAPNTLHISMIKASLRPAWVNPKGLEFHSLGANRFLAEFGCKADKDRVKEGSPRTISKHCILLMDFEPSLKPGDVCFDSLSMWVRILNLPFNLMNDDRGKALASTLGKVEKMDVDNKGRAWGDYLRARISIVVNQPLMRCVSVFSQKRRVTDVYQVLMWVNLPLLTSQSGSDASVLGPNNASSKAHGKVVVGQDFTTPKQRKARANHANIISSPDQHNLVDVSIADAGSGKLTNITGQKRKVYLPMAQVQQNIVFEETIVDQILQVPISCFGDPDFVSLPHTRSATYSVRSAYHLARMTKMVASRSGSGRGMSSNLHGDAISWI
ncbi:hypothetical protein D1007_38294 [Hordeum vulgare]|nr:hypothetical protein D1007_38294 [Hordeum vulgare]